MTGHPLNAVRLALLGASLLLACPAAAADDVITLRIADSLPSGHFLYDAVTRPFIQAAEQASNGRIKFRHFPAEQLGKSRDMLRLTQHGVMDIGYVVPSYQPDKLPLSAVAELPGSFGNDLCIGTHAFWNLTREGGFLRTQEFDRHGVRPLAVFMMSGYNIELSNGRHVAHLEDLRGLKIRTAGSAMDLLVSSLGAVPMHLSPGEIYESMARGTIDGTILAHQSVVSYKLVELLKSSTTDQNLASVALTYSISEKRWRELPPDVQRALQVAGEKITFEACQNLGKREASVRANVMSRGLKEIRLAGEDQAKLQQVFAGVRRQWADIVNRQGKPGDAAVAAWNEAVREVTAEQAETADTP